MHSLDILRGLHHQRILKFISVGVLNTLFGYGIYAVLVFIDLPYLIALFIATLAGITFNYFSIGRLVFKSKGGLNVFAKFIATYGVVYFVNAVGLEVSIKHFQVGPYIGQALCVPLSVLLSWVLMNYWVYKND
jgi:putative flippase GtrA